LSDKKNNKNSKSFIAQFSGWYFSGDLIALGCYQRSDNGWDTLSKKLPDSSIFVVCVALGREGGLFKTAFKNKYI